MNGTLPRQQDARAADSTLHGVKQAMCGAEAGCMVLKETPLVTYRLLVGINIDN